MCCHRNTEESSIRSQHLVVVLNVLFGRNPFEIACLIVGLVSVLVVYLKSWLVTINPCPRYDRVNGFVHLLTIQTKVYSHITVLVWS